LQYDASASSFLIWLTYFSRYQQHYHVTFKLREVVKPYKKIIGFAAVSLQGAAAACDRGKTTSFMIPLRLQGLVCGKSLSFTLFWFLPAASSGSSAVFTAESALN
jgi:hypothetical protein